VWGDGPAVARTAAVLCWLPAVGFGPLCIPAMASIARGDGVWTFLGFPTYGGAAFEQLGIPTSVPLLAAFLLVAVAEVIVGALLWRRRRAGFVSALALLPVELVFWIGFALPFGPVVGVARTALVLIALRRRGQRSPRIW
jgi:hypothetical protein